MRALEVWDDGDGPALYAAGDFTHAGGVPAPNVARWDGSTWSAVQGPGGNGIDGEVGALQVFDDGGGPALYAAGSFLHVDGVEVRRLAPWDGTAWSGLSGPSAMGVDDSAVALTVHDDGTGPALWIGGFFTEIGGAPGRRIARWDGSLLSVPAAGGADGSIRTMGSWNDGSGSALYVGGVLTEAGGVAVNRIARLAAGNWSRLGGAVGQGFNGVVRTSRSTTTAPDRRSTPAAS